MGKTFKIATILGARPQFVKAATISRIISPLPDVRELVIHTGQHYDSNMSEIFFNELNIPRPDYNLAIGSGSHGKQTGLMLMGIEEILLKERPDYVIIYGDTNSTIAGALASVKLHIPVAHVEAGLRSFNRRMPEEINRITSDHISEVLYAPTKIAVDNLVKEGLGDATVLSGDVMFDLVLFYQDFIEKNPDDYVLDNIPDQFYLATIHRPSNTDEIVNLKQILKAFNELPYPVVFPVHPRFKKAMESHRVDLPGNVTAMPPLGYLKMLKLISDSKKVLTDSGGIQKEAYILKTPCITIRNETEWVETQDGGWNILTGANTEKILLAAASEVDETVHHDYYGDGKAADLIVQHLLSILNGK